MEQLVLRVVVVVFFNWPQLNFISQYGQSGQISTHIMGSILNAQVQQQAAGFLVRD